MPEQNVVEYRDFGCIFRLDREKNVLHVQGPEDAARIGIMKLQRQGWLREPLRAIWFSGEVPRLYVGTDLTVFLACSGSDKPVLRKQARTFRDIVGAGD